MNSIGNKRIGDFLLEKRADWIVEKKNPPMASHMDGIWERQIRIPMVVETINDINGDMEFSPSHILTMKAKVVMPPPGVFGKSDLYCPRRWRRIQHISHEF